MHTVHQINKKFTIRKYDFPAQLDDKIHFLHTQEKLISHDIAALALIS